MAAEGDDDDRQSASEESENEGVLRSMRRRAASDDEGGEQSDGREEPHDGRDPRGEGIGSGGGGDSDDEGAAQEYDDDDEEERSEEDVDAEEEFDEDDLGDEGREAVVAEEEKDVGGVLAAAESREEGPRGEEPDRYEGDDRANEEVKVENAPYAVPTGGAFYMHDDRFRQNGRGRQRRMFGGQKLWENKDDQVWVHDRFEELNLQDARHDQGRRSSRGRFRGRGRSRAMDSSNHGFVGVNKGHAYNNDNYQYRALRTVKGRGPRRYELIKRGQEISANRNNEYVKSHEVISNTTMGRASSTPPVEPASSVLPKTALASNLNYASPPFYPSGSSNKDAFQSHKSISKSGTASNRNLSSLSMQIDGDFTSSQRGNLKGKGLVSTDYDDLYMEDSMQAAAGRASAATQLQSSLSDFSSINTNKYPESRAQERNKSMNESLNNHTMQSSNLPPQFFASTDPAAHQRLLQNPAPLASRVFTQPIGQQSGYGVRASPPPEACSPNSVEDEGTESTSEPGKPKSQLVRYAKPNTQGQARGSFLYNGAQVLGATGAMGIANGDQGFPATPTLLPFMQIGGQHHGGVGVPAVGVALPGYMAQPNGYGNSEMTWLPVLAGAAGALGATYSPYIALDSSFIARSSGQATSTSSSLESNATKPSEVSKQPQRPDILNEEFSHRQSKPRRYSEMTFGQ